MPRLPRVRTSSRLIAVTVATVAGILPLVAGSSARADTPSSPGPVIVSPADGAEVAGTAMVEVSAPDAAYVRLGVSTTRTGLDWLAPVAVEGATGRAAVALPTWGLRKMQLLVSPCASPEPASCASWTDNVTLVPTNQPPVISTPAAKVLVQPEVDRGLTVEATGGGPAVEFFLDGATVRSTPRQPAFLDLTNHGDGTGQLWAFWCNPVLDVCDGPNGHGPDVVVRDQIHAGIASVSRTVLSNAHHGTDVYINGDTELYAAITWTLERSGRVYARPNGVTHVGAGWPGSATVDLASTATRPIVDGRYQLRIVLHSESYGHDFDKTLWTALRVDLTPPGLRDLAVHRTRSGVLVRGETSRDARVVRAVVVDGSGRVVRTLAGGTVRASRLAGLVWDGRRETGEPAPAGRYRVRVVVADPAGNQTRRQAPFRVPGTHR